MGSWRSGSSQALATAAPSRAAKFLRSSSPSGWGSIWQGARIEIVDDVPIAVIRRFDRAAGGGRLPYLSGGSLLQAQPYEDRAFSDSARCSPSGRCGTDAGRAAAMATNSSSTCLSPTLTTTCGTSACCTSARANGGSRRRSTSIRSPSVSDIRTPGCSEDTGPVPSLEMLLGYSEYFSARAIQEAQAEGGFDGRHAQAVEDGGHVEDVGLTERGSPRSNRRSSMRRPRAAR